MKLFVTKSEEKTLRTPLLGDYSSYTVLHEADMYNGSVGTRQTMGTHCGVQKWGGGGSWISPVRCKEVSKHSKWVCELWRHFMGFKGVSQTSEAYVECPLTSPPSQGAAFWCIVILLCVLSKSKTHTSEGKGIDVFCRILRLVPVHQYHLLMATSSLCVHSPSTSPMPEVTVDCLLHFIPFLSSNNLWWWW